MRLTLIFIPIFLIFGSLKSDNKPPSNRRVFVACPVVQDSKTMPCWLVDYEEKRYYLGQQGSTASAFYPPQLKHKVLVEGTIKEGVEHCGGIVLDPVVISVLPELSLECSVILPSVEGIEPPPPLPRAIEPKFQNDTRKFTILMDFDSDYLTLHRTRILDEIDRIARLNPPKKIKISTFRTAVLLSNGQILTETEKIAQRRANKIFEIFEGLGYSTNIIETTINQKPRKPNGINDHLNRKIEIELLN